MTGLTGVGWIGPSARYPIAKTFHLNVFVSKRYKLPQEPLDQATLDFVLETVDPAADAALVRGLAELPDACAWWVRLSGSLLQLGCRAGLTLWEIAQLIVRPELDSDELSDMERASHDAMRSQAELLDPGVQDYTEAAESRLWEFVEQRLRELVETQRCRR